MYTLYNIRQTLCGLIKGIICLWHGRNTCKQIFILCTTQIAFTASIKKYETITKKPQSAAHHRRIIQTIKTNTR